MEVVFPHLDTDMTSPVGSPDPATHSPPASQISQKELDYTMVMTMVQKLNAQLGDIYTDNDKIRSVCDGLLRDYPLRDEAIENLTQLVKRAVDCMEPQRPHRDMAAPRAMVPSDLIDTDGNLRAADIGITWQGSETFLHGVKVVGPHTAGSPSRRRRRHHTYRCGNMPPVTCRHHHLLIHRAWSCPTHMFTGHHTITVRDTDRPPRSNGLTIKLSTGHRGSATSKQWWMFMVGIGTGMPCS